MPPKRIVIIGGGFGGVKCARLSAGQFRPGDAELILFNKENHLVFSPLLADAVGSSLSLDDVIVPLRQLLPGSSAAPRTSRAWTSPAAGSNTRATTASRATSTTTTSSWPAATSRTSTSCRHGRPRLPAEDGGDAAVLRTHVLSSMEKAEVCDNPEKRRWYLSFVVVGGGYSGVETAGEINDLVRSSLRFYSNIRDDDVSVTLIHSRDQLLPEISPQLREFARKKMEMAGVTMKLNARVMLATGEGVGLKDDFVRGGTIVCTIGSTTAPVIDRLDTPKEKGRVLTEPTCACAAARTPGPSATAPASATPTTASPRRPPASSPSVRAGSARTTSSG